jgi:DNA-binding MarR family transcriptional regulator
MGLARQSVQRIADELVRNGVLILQENPNHKRAPMLVLTARGRQTFKGVTFRQVPWVNALARGVPVGDLRVAIQVLRRLEQQLEESAQRVSRR